MTLTFAFGASGLSKSIHANQNFTNASVEIGASSLNEVVQKCCNHDKEKTDTSNQRCIGDICISPIAVAADAVNVWQIHYLHSLTHITTRVQTSFLRPPII